MTMLLVTAITAVAVAFIILWLISRRRSRRPVSPVATARVSALRDTLERKVRNGEL